MIHLEDVFYEDLAYPEAFHCFEEDYSQKNWQVLPHWHPYMEMVYVQSGRVNVFLNGSYHKLHKGDFVFIDSLLIHAFLGKSQWNSKMIILKFDKHLLFSTYASFEPLFFQMMSVDHRLFHFGFLFIHNSIDSAQMAAYLHSILQENRQRRFGFELAIRTLIGQVFLWVIRQREADYSLMSERFKEEKPFYKPLKQMMEYVI